jgi:multicomponent Na+:H+ antiporter subunit B
MTAGSVRKVFNILVLVLFGLVFAGIVAAQKERQELPPLAASYVKLVPQELGAPNVVTGILLHYRALDTIGEVAVLFMVAAGVGLLLGGGSGQGAPAAPKTPPSELVRTGATILTPLIAMFAAYIIMNGHISAGGGFQGGAVIACAVLLTVLGRPEYVVPLGKLSAIESLAGILFILVGIAGIVWAGGFLDSQLLPLGQFGTLFSAGTLPVLSVFLGIKVGCELSVIVGRFRG